MAARLPARRFPDMIIDCAHYHDGRRRDEGPVPLQEAAARCGQGGFFGVAGIVRARAKRNWPRSGTPSACMNWPSRTRRTFTCGRRSRTMTRASRRVILRSARYDDDAEEVEFGEISIFLAPTFVIAVRQGVASELRGARQRLEQRPELLATGSTAALWATWIRWWTTTHRSSPGSNATSTRLRSPNSWRLRADRTDLLAAPRGH